MLCILCRVLLTHQRCGWTSGVILGILLTQCCHSQLLLEAIWSILPNAYIFSYCIIQNKSRKGRFGGFWEPFLRKFRWKDIIWVTFPSWRSLRFASSWGVSLFQVLYRRRLLSPSPWGLPGFPSTSWSCSFPGALLPRLPSRNSL